MDSYGGGQARGCYNCESTFPPSHSAHNSSTEPYVLQIRSATDLSQFLPSQSICYIGIWPMGSVPSVRWRNCRIGADRAETHLRSRLFSLNTRAAQLRCKKTSADNHLRWRCFASGTTGRFHSLISMLFACILTRNQGSWLPYPRPS